MNNKTIFMKAALTCLGMVKEQSPMPRRFIFNGIEENMTATYTRFFNELILKGIDKETASVKTNVKLGTNMSVESHISYVDQNSDSIVSEELTSEEKVALTNLTLLTMMCQIIVSIMAEEGMKNPKPEYIVDDRTEYYCMFDKHKIEHFVPRIKHYFPLTNYSDNFIAMLVEAVVFDRARMCNVSSYRDMVQATKYDESVLTRFNIEDIRAYRNFDIEKVDKGYDDESSYEDGSYIVRKTVVTGINTEEISASGAAVTFTSRCAYTSQFRLSVGQNGDCFNISYLDNFNGVLEKCYKEHPKDFYDYSNVRFPKDLFCTLIVKAYIDCIKVLGGNEDYVSQIQKLVDEKEYYIIYCLLWHNTDLMFQNRLIGNTLYCKSMPDSLCFKSRYAITLRCNKKTMVNPFLFKSATDKAIEILSPEYLYLGEFENADK